RWMHWRGRRWGGLRIAQKAGEVMVTTTAAVATVHHWIGGQHVAAESGRVGAVHNPATGEVIAEVGFATAEEVDRAVATAKAAFAEWRATPLSRRAEVMFR